MIGLYIVAKFSNTDIGFWELVKLKFKGIDTTLFVRSMVLVKKGGIDFPKEEILSLIKDKRNVINIVNFLLVSKKNNFDFSVNEAIRVDKMEIDFMNELRQAENIQEKFKEIRNKILLSI